MSQVASCQRLTMGTQVRAQDTMEAGEGPSGTVTVSLPVPKFAPVSIIPAILHTRSFTLLLILAEGQMSKERKQCSFRYQGIIGQKSDCIFVQASEGKLSRCKTCNFNVFYIKRNCFSYRHSVLWGR